MEEGGEPVETCKTIKEMLQRPGACGGRGIIEPLM